MVSTALGLVVAAGAIGWTAGASITSPAEAAARAQPPEASLITVAVDERVLSADVIARGSIDFDDPESLSLSGATGDPEAKQIITFIPEEGTDLPEGSVVLEVAGRPVFLLQGDISVYRDMRPGATGVDVEQLEDALVRLGYLSSADSKWDNRTGAAIQAMYAAAGYNANTTTDADAAALKSARDFVRSASQALADAEKAIATSGAVTGSTVLQAQAAVADAQDALDIAEAARTAAIAAANNDVSVAAAFLVSAQAALDLADARLAQASPPTSIHPDTGLPPTGPELAVLNNDVANANVALVQAGNAVTDAGNDLVTITAEQDAAVDSAQRLLDIAQAQLDELLAPHDITELIRARDAAKRDLQTANQALVKIEATIGTWLPAGELIFLDRMPVHVARLALARGDIVTGPFMTVSGADIAMIVGLQESDAKRLSVGDTVIIDEPELLPEPIEATISEIPEAGSSGRVQVKVTLATIPEELLGANVRVIIPVESTSGMVLVVPAAALSAVANGDTRVEVEDPDNPGTTRFVTVTTGLAADGVVEVHPVDGSLVKGDRVVVGQADIGPAGVDATSAGTTGTDTTGNATSGG